jgi:Ca2+-binding RTX toxin-like protein
MTLTINLTSTRGVNFNSGFTSFFADVTPTGWPYILGGSSQFAGKQIVLLDDIVTGQERNTKTVVIDGANINYYFNDHTLSGTLSSIRLATLGNSYNSSNGGFAQGSTGLIANISTTIEIKGLKITNAYQTVGDFHNAVVALMGGSHEGGRSDPSKLASFVWAEAHRVNGSAGNDTYTGTRFSDLIYGNGGADRLNGADGNDIIKGGIGADTMTGGRGNDRFYADNARDRAIESSSGGTDLVIASTSHTLASNVENLTLTGSAALRGSGNGHANTITGNAGANTLNGASGDDVLKDMNGNDTLYGAYGADDLYGGSGRDTFVFKSIAESTMLTTRRDTIFDFTSSDKIDLRSIDSNTRVAGNQDFTFIGTGQFTNTAGEVRYQRLASDTMIYGDVDGNGVADFSIHLDDALTLSRTCFLL